MKKILLSLALSIASGGVLLAQCALGTQYGTSAAPAAGTSTQVVGCAFGGEYTEITGVVGGESYDISYVNTSVGGSMDITIYDATFTPVAWGVDLIAGWVAPSSGTFYSQPNPTGCGTNTDCYDGTWTSNAVATAYCTPAPTSVDGNGITNVTVGTINNTTGAEPGNYGDYTAQVTDAIQGLPLAIDITLQTGFTYNLFVWIDWNDDFDFLDANEAQYLGESTSANPTTFSGTITVPAGAALGNHRMRIGGADTGLGTTTPSNPCYTGSWGSFEDYTINVIAPPPCLPVSAGNATNITNATADLNWTAPAGAVDYAVEWGAVGFTPGTGAELGSASAVVGTTTPASGLSGSTTYHFYVQTNCGATQSSWTGPYSFTTLCDPVVAPWVENFNATTTPTCWTQSTTTGGPWVFNGEADLGNMTGIDINDHTTGAVNTGYAWVDQSSTDVGVILRTPLIDVSALSNPELRFWILSHNNNGTVGTTYNPIHVEAWDGAAWQSVAIIQGDFGFQWVEFNFLTSAYTFNTNLQQFRFRAESGGSGSDFDNDVLLDDVSVIQAPTCPQPSALTLVDADNSTATLSWTENAGATEWNVIYGPAGFDPTTSGTTVNTTTNPTTLTGLPSDQIFDVYVYSVCIAGVDSSFLTGPISFDTYNQPTFMDWNTACPPAGFVDISGVGTNLNLTDDSEVAIDPLPFSVFFQGQLMTNMTIGNNGGLVLGSTTAQVGTFANFNTAVNGTLGAWLDDLDDETGDVYAAVVGTSPNSVLVIQWDNSNNWPAGSGTVTFQIQIEEATGEIYYVYDDVIFGDSPADDFGGNADIGISGANQDYTISTSSQTYLQNNSCVHFFYTDCPNPQNFTVTYTTTSEAGITWNAGLYGETDWTVIYGLQGFDPTTGGTTVNTTVPAAVLTGLDDITTYDVYIYADCNPGTLQSEGFMGTFTTLPNCADVTGVTTATAVDSVFSSWTFVENPGFPSTGFNIQYGWSGFGLYDGTQTIVNADNNFTDTTEDFSLMAGGVYQLYVQSVCGTDTSGWTGPIQFIMPLTNDTTCFAEMLAVDGTVYTFNNAGATVQTGEASIAPPATGLQTSDGWGSSAMSFTTWYTFVAPPSGNVRFDNTDINFNGQIAIYEVTDCSDFGTFTLLGANDNSLIGGSTAPRFSVCGLTPGSTYYIVHDSWSTTATGTYAMSLSEIVVEAGTSAGLINVCTGDTVDLYTGISGNDAGGVWSETIPTASFNDPLFPTAGLAYQMFEFEYMVTDGCAQDSVTQQVQIYGPALAGNDGVINVCMNEPFDLVSGLSGTVDLGGTWYDPSNNVVSNTQMMASNIPGQFNYDYVASNGVCQNDTANIVVNVSPTCDWLNIAELGLESIDLYPNPTSGMIYITNEGSTEVFSYELTDLNGKVIASKANAINGTETTSIDLGKLEPGVYLIKVANENVEHTFRVIKQ